jgi:hypothetical protein
MGYYDNIACNNLNGYDISSINEDNNKKLSDDEIFFLKNIAKDLKKKEQEEREAREYKRDIYIKKYTKKSFLKNGSFYLILFLSTIIFGVISFFISLILGSDTFCAISIFIGLSSLIWDPFREKYENYEDPKSFYVDEKIRRNHKYAFKKKEIKKLAKAYKKYYEIKDIIEVNK